MRIRSRRKIVVVVATHNKEALAAIEQAGDRLPLEQRQAITTEGVYGALPGAHLVVADVENLVEAGGLSRSQLAEVLAQKGLLAVRGDEFAAAAERWLDEARAASGIAEALPPRVVGFTGLAGGVGKTTLALSLARFFHERTGLPAAVIELSFGPSALTALLGGGKEFPHLLEIARQGQACAVWNRGVALAPMVWDSATQLLGEDGAWDAWATLAARSVLTVFDGPYSHPWWRVAASLMHMAFAVTDGRQDALAAAAYLAELGECESWSVRAGNRVVRGGLPTRASAEAWVEKAQQDGGMGLVVQPQQVVGLRVLLNRGGLLSRIALQRSPVASLPDAGRSAMYSPKLGRALMRLVYPGWGR